MENTRPTSPDELATLRTAFALVRQPVFILEPAERRIVDANPAGCQILNLARGELVGQAWCAFVAHLAESEMHEIDLHGERYLIMIHQPALDQSQQDAAHRDVLTGLPNRQALLARFAAGTDDPARGGFSLMFIDLDNFKQVNDTCGHLFGDRVLQIVAERLLGSLRKSDLVVRYGGDEFLVVVEGVRREDLERRACDIAHALEAPMLIDGRELFLSASIGIARQKTETLDAEALIAEADRAMYRAKGAGRASEAAARLAIAPTQSGRRLA
jgi:diguanylate cyclase (GGDEF)-like protein